MTVARNESRGGEGENGKTRQFYLYIVNIMSM